MFQSSPSGEAGRSQELGRRGALDHSCFNPRPAVKLGAAMMTGLSGAWEGLFQSSPSGEAGRSICLSWFAHLAYPSFNPRQR